MQDEKQYVYGTGQKSNGLEKKAIQSMPIGISVVGSGKENTDREIGVYSILSYFSV